MKIVFTGGGTLGHVMPNIYLMEEFKSGEISYIGSNGIEKEAVKNLDYYTIPAVKLARGKFFSNLKIPFVLINSIFKCRKILKKIKPDVVFSKGGYVALPVCISAKMLKIPIIAHESDSSFGLANKIILKTCKYMCVNFKHLEEKNTKTKHRIIYTGPIFSKDFESNRKNFSGLKLEENKKTILIVGGSLGSKIINDNLFPIIKDLIKNYNLIHITGKGNMRIKSHDNYNAFETVKDMVNLYNIADAVVGRSGAGVSAESYFKKLPMLLIPLQNKATRGDQMQNAKYYKNLGVAEILSEIDLTPTTLFASINNFMQNLDKYAKKYTSLKQVNGRESIVNLIKNMV